MTSAPATALCWEVSVSGHSDVTHLRLFVCGQFGGVQQMSRLTERPVWAIHAFPNGGEAANWALDMVADWERQYSTFVTVEPGEVMVYESEYARLGEGVIIPPSLRVRIIARMRRHRRAPAIVAA